MKLGVISQNLLHFETADEGLQYAHDLGFDAIEVGACALWNTRFCNVDELVKDRGEIDRWKDKFAKYGLEVSALGGHGAPLTPNKEAAAKYTQQFRTVCRFMEMAEVRLITLLAGLPEGAEGDTAPNWVTFAEWPHLRDTLEWQWEKRLLPYWREQAKIASDHGVTLCFEMHGGDMIFNPATMMRLREELGPVACCNLDFGHLWYQSIDPIAAVRYLGDVIQHVHAKDTVLHQDNVRVKGLMDHTSTERPAERSWNYTLVGWGHDERIWKEFITTLRLVGYDHVLSLEMECEFMNVAEGLEKSVQFLKPLILEKPTGAKWWELVGMERAGGLDVQRDEG
jgi:sugar phosphate isomerase/epimerase